MMIEAIRERRSIRAYLKKDIEDDKLREILTAAMFAPTSWGTCAWEFVLVRDPQIKSSLSEASSHATFVKDAPLIIVVCYDTQTGRRFREDSSIAASHIMLEAVNQGLSSCFVQVADAGDPPGTAEPHVKKVLGVPDNFRVQCMLPIGYAKRPLKPHGENEYKPSKAHIDRF